MIGKVTFDGGEIVLTDEMELEGDDPHGEAEQLWNRYRRNYSPADGSPGGKFLHELAHRLRGRVEWEEKPKQKSPDGRPVIY